MKLKKLSALLSAGIFALSACFFNTQLAIANTTDDDEVYVLMNIPYDEFYQNEITNTVKVDSVSSATKAKTRTGRLTNGSYHIDDSGESIDGITFYVKTTKEDLAALTGAEVITDDSTLTITVTNRGKETTTTYEGSDALYEAPDYSYYILDEAPSYYKEMSVSDGTVSFSEIKGTYDTIAVLTAGEDISYTFTNDSSYGDFQLDFDTDEGAAVLSSYFDYETDDIYGVIVETEEGGQYALRHLENIWLGTKLAWSAGVITDVHGCELSYEHYVAMIGETITSVTYLTENGKIVINGLSETVELMEFEAMTDEQRTQLEELYAVMTELLEDYDSDTATAAEGDLYEHMRETSTLLRSAKASVAAADELLEELPEKIQAVQDERASQVETTTEDSEEETTTDDSEEETTTEDSEEETTDADEEESSTTEAPDTGDRASASLFAVAAAVAVICGGAVCLRKKKA